MAIGDYEAANFALKKALELDPSLRRSKSYKVSFYLLWFYIGSGKISPNINDSSFKVHASFFLR